MKNSYIRLVTLRTICETYCDNTGPQSNFQPDGLRQTKRDSCFQTKKHLSRNLRGYEI